jgi:uncharacterized membrane protein
LNGWLLAATTFLACGVEAVEAATIVLAVTLANGWRPALGGTAVALAALAVATTVGAPLLANAASLAWVEAIVGLFLIYVGFTWLRKAVLRYAGRKALHDEAAIFDRELASLRERREARYGFAIAFQGVLTEGLEVAVIVVTFSASSPQNYRWSIAGALAAIAVVTVAACALHAPLTRVPENTMKAIVGVMLVSLGTFWAGEGLRVQWWFGDITILMLIAAYALATASSVLLLRRAT